MFQIIRNTCSTPGIVDYLNNRAAAANRGQYLDTVEMSPARVAQRMLNVSQISRAGFSQGTWNGYVRA